MTVDVDTVRANGVATILESKSFEAGSFHSFLMTLGFDLQIVDFTVDALKLASEIEDELSLTAQVLRARVSLAETADRGGTVIFSLIALGSSERQLRAALDDGDGAAGTDQDHRAHLERLMFPDGVPKVPTVFVDPAQWTAENVTAVYLDDATPEQAEEYWDLLSPEQRLAVIVVEPGSVSDHHIPGNIDLVPHEVFALQIQPILPGGRAPSVAGADYAGVAIPPPGTPTSADVEVPEDGEWRSVAGGTVICDLIQFGSVLPTRPDSDREIAADTAKRVADGVDIARTATTPVKAFSPSTYLATLADIGLCRLRPGSGDPISSDRVLDDDGEMVYESSRSPTQPNMDSMGVTLHPDLTIRDKQVWQAEFPLGTPEYRPYPGFPAYDQEELAAL